MGIVIDKELAMATSCHGYKDPKTGELFVWSPGVVGMLSDPQEKIFCKTVETETKLPKRIIEFKKAVAEAHKKIEKIPMGKRLIPWLEAMSIELKKRGIEV